MLVFGINDASLLFLFFASSTWLDLISVVGNPFMEFFEAASAKGLVVETGNKGGDKSSSVQNDKETTIDLAKD